MDKLKSDLEEKINYVKNKARKCREQINELSTFLNKKERTTSENKKNSTSRTTKRTKNTII
ncbi:MAG: hypothetical protein J6P19_03475 [Acetobacter sp.]|nr:hypothetical protein [Acetobacter sp.]